MSSDREEDRRSVLATIDQLRGSLVLSAHDEEAAQAVAAGLRDAKAANTTRVYTSAWHEFNVWALANGRQSLPAEPQTVALHLGRLAADGKAMATIEQARAAISHAHAAEGTAKGDNPARHPVVAEAVKGWRNQAAAPRQGRRADRRCPGPGPRDCPAAPAWTRGAHGVGGLGEDFSRHNGRVGMARRMVAAGAPTAVVQHQGRWKHGNMAARYTRGEAAEEALKWLS